MTQSIDPTQETTDARRFPTLRLLLVPAALLAAACDDSSNPIAPEEFPSRRPRLPPRRRPRRPPAPWRTCLLGRRLPLGRHRGRQLVPVVERLVQPERRRHHRDQGGGHHRPLRRPVHGALRAARREEHGARVRTGTKLGATYCKPVGAFLVRDSVEVRCYRIGTGAAVNTDFQLNVLGKRDDRAFAFANQPTATSYAPASAGSWNPAARPGSTATAWAGTGWSSPGSAPVSRRTRRPRAGQRRRDRQGALQDGAVGRVPGPLRRRGVLYPGGGAGGREVHDDRHAAGRAPGLRLGRPADAHVLQPPLLLQLESGRRVGGRHPGPGGLSNTSTTCPRLDSSYCSARAAPG